MPVPAEWPTQPPKLALIGEEPSHHELAVGRPFVGPIGRLLGGLLRASGIDRPACLLTNASTEPGGPMPPTREQRARLELECVEAGVGVLVTLGAYALHTLTGKSPRGKLSKLRGVPFDWAGGWVVPTFHPGSIVKGKPQNRVYIFEDLRLAKEIAEGRVPEPLEPEIEVAEGPAEIEQWLREVGPRELLAVDIETAKGGIDCIGFGAAERALVVPLYDAKTREPWWPKEVEQEILGLLKDILESPQPKVFQNGTYDVWWIYERWGIRVHGWVHDDRLIHHALYPELPKDLGSMASLHLRNLPAWKAG